MIHPETPDRKLQLYDAEGTHPARILATNPHMAGDDSMEL
jgi:hypothetical protein